MSSFKDLDNLLQRFVDDGLPGCGMVIAKKGEVLYENYFGYADIENKVPVTQDNLFRQASLTKVALYTCGMMLYEQGKFLMTDPLYEYFPEWKDAKKWVYSPNGDVKVAPLDNPVTVKSIFNMTLGMPYGMIMGNQPGGHPTAKAMNKRMQALREKGHYTLREEIAAMSEVPLAFEPGTQWLYGFASELTAGLLEAVCGKPAEEVLREMLYEPLEMKYTNNYLTEEMKPKLVGNYRIVKGKKLGEPGALELAPNRNEGPRESVSGFQRVITNPSEYTHLLQMLANGGFYKGEKIMGRKSIDLIRTSTITDHMYKNGFTNDYLCGYRYGYGMRTLVDKYEGHHNGSIGQFGWTGGAGTWGEADPSEGTSIVYMHNLSPNMEEYHHLRMRAVAYGCLSDL